MSLKLIIISEKQNNGRRKNPRLTKNGDFTKFFDHSKDEKYFIN